MMIKKLVLFIFFICFSLRSIAIDYDTTKYESTIRNFELKDKLSKPKAGANLFVGSSTITKWQDMAAYFSETYVLNRGFGGSQFVDLSYYAQRIIPHLKPSRIFIYEGDNDIASGKKVEDVLNEARLLRIKISEMLPGTPVVFISVKPSPSRWHLRDKYVQYNKLLAAYAGKTKKTKFADLWTVMLDKDEKVLKNIFLKDSLHMNAEGYRIWQKALAPYLKKVQQKWKLVWKDEFKYTGLPDESKWSYEEGLVRNKESQYYTKARKENAYVKNGFLTITARNEKYKNDAYKPDTDNWKSQDSLAAYTSAALITKGKHSWTYGKVEVRAKLPKGMGVWPAIWMLGTNIDQVGWPACGEIDIMEYVGFEPENIYATLHLKDPLTGKRVRDGKRTQLKEPFAGFHNYILEWDSWQIKIFCDNQLYQIVDIDRAGKGIDSSFRNPQYLLLNLALGGSWGGKIDENIFPQEFVIDYVRVYK